jgi:hypothetical protein
MRRIVTIIALTFAIGLFTAISGAGATEPPTLTFEMLEKTVFSDTPPPTFPAELSQLEGKRIHITGFAAPYDDPEHLMKMVVLKSPGGCFFCSPPPATAVVFVRRAAGDPSLKNVTDPVDVEGTLLLWRSEMKDDDAAKGFLFTIDEAKVTVKKK